MTEKPLYTVIAGEKIYELVNNSGKSLSKWTRTDTRKKSPATPALVVSVHIGEEN